MMLRDMRNRIVGFLFGGAMRKTFKLGILYSTTGPYAAIGRECRDGAQFAIEQCARILPGLIEPVFVDPQGNMNDYVEGELPPENRTVTEATI